MIIRSLEPYTEPLEPVKELIPLCRKMAAEGAVLLKNEGVLPFRKGETVAVFGRGQERYKKGGTGSGWTSNNAYEPDLLRALRENGVFTIDEETAARYAAWSAEHPYDNGNGWHEPWSQVEMPVDAEPVESASRRASAALVFLQRQAGEGKDCAPVKGSWYLSDDEEKMLAEVTRVFERTAVVLNVSNTMDLGFMDRYPIGALMLGWQGGQEGANALVNLLAGKISPSGKLVDTQAALEDYPAFMNFGDEDRVFCEEDIFVGYRYFESFAPDKVRYPFGFGLTYTQFELTSSAAISADGAAVEVAVTVKNVGNFAAKEVAQLYFEAPANALGTPKKQLAAYRKTHTLLPGEEESFVLRVEIAKLASYDDAGVTGEKSCYVLLPGDYKLYLGTDAKTENLVYTYSVETLTVTERLQEVLAPVTPFERLTAEFVGTERKPVKRPAPLRSVDLDARIKANRPETLAYTGDCGIRLKDVAEGRNSIEEFIAQLSDDDLCALVVGEGMYSPKTTPSTGGIMGGVTDRLLDFGIPICTVTDGPAGMRIANEFKTTSIPSCTTFASSFNDELTEELFAMLGTELERYHIDALLGPGMNIHRHPLCGRNFEYFSEDPLLSGRMAAAMSRGLAKNGCSSTIKHCCVNTQEAGRDRVDMVVSERALREIYLKGFEIAVREGGATALMTSYNSVNGFWNASQYDLTQTVLRDEWGYTGFVMTDWWAKSNFEGEFGDSNNLAAMIRAHNDIFMVCTSAEGKIHNLYEGLESGFIVRGDLQLAAKHILTYIMKAPCFKRFRASGYRRPEFEEDNSVPEVVAVLERPVSGREYRLSYPGEAKPMLEFVIEVYGDPLVQHPVVIYVNDKVACSLSVSGRSQGTLERKSILKPTGEGESVIFRAEYPENVKLKRLSVKQ